MEDETQNINFRQGNRAANQVFGNQTNTTHINQSHPTCPRPPARSDPFAGRDAEIEELIETLKAGGSTAITAAVQGLGGIGKTALALKLAHQLHNDGTFGAVLWTRVTRQPDVIPLLVDWAADCGMSYTPTSTDVNVIGKEVRARVHNAITNTCEDCDRVLVVLDDVWDNGIEIAKLLQRYAPHNASVLITTRSEKVATRTGSQIKSLDKFTPEDGLKVMRLRLPDADEDVLKTIVQALGGHALALKLAAQRARDEPERLQRHAEQYASRIPEGEFKTLDLEQDEAEDNLRLVLSYSYDELSEENRRYFRYLGVLTPDSAFNETLLGQLWGIDDSEACYAIIKQLRQLALLERDDDLSTGETTWYSQHPLLRAYARALLKQYDELSTAQDAYTDAIISISQKFVEWKDQPEKWGVLTPYFSHINAVGDDLVKRYGAGDESQAGRVVGFAGNIYPYLFRRREHAVARGETWFRAGIHAAQATDNANREAWFSGELGTLLNHLGRNHEGLPLLIAALKLAQQTNDQYYAAVALNNIGAIYQARGELDTALDYFQLALPIWREVGDRSGEARSLNNIGAIYRARGELDTALDYHEQALTIHREVGDRSDEASSLNSIGAIYQARSELDTALDYFQQALDIQREVGGRSGEARSLNNIGAIYRARGELDTALDYHEQALTIHREVGDRSGEASSLNSIGAIYQARRSELDTALDYYEQSLDIQREVGDRSGEASSLNSIGAIYRDRGELDTALDYYEQSLDIQREVGDRSDEARSLHNIGAIYQDQGDSGAAVKSMQQAVNLMREHGLTHAGGRPLKFFEQRLKQLQREHRSKEKARRTRLNNRKKRKKKKKR